MIISIANQKGGVAKTTTSINLGYCLSMLGKKVLLIDIDPQANMSKGIDAYTQENTIYDCLLGNTNVLNAIHTTKYERLDIIPATIRLSNAELELSTVLGRESILQEMICQDNINYDYIIIDCNPSLGLLTVNALTSSDKIIIPMEASLFSFEGIEQLINVTQLIKKKLNNRLDILGVLLTRIDSRTNISRDFKNHLKDIFKDKVFNTVIHQNVKIADSQTNKVPINVWDKTSKGAIEYLELAKEVIERE